MTTESYSLISIEDPAAIQRELQRLGLVDPAERVRQVSRAGEGNMNLVLRVVTDRRSVVVKQSRPWVEKYPQIAAPAERVLGEIDFYARVESVPFVAGQMPSMLGHDVDRRILVLEDLGPANDFSGLYQSRRCQDYPAAKAIRWLTQLHRVELPADQAGDVGNQQLRELNHAHMFTIPFESPSPVSLDHACAGLEAVADEFRRESALSEAADELGERYLARGGRLLHGDFYPGSWLHSETGFHVIDPEFCFAGPAEFDLAIFAAHYLLIGGSPDWIESMLADYTQLIQQPPNDAARFQPLDSTLVRRWAGAEIIRRLIGVAQLPLEIDLNKRRQLLQQGRALLLT